MIIMNRTLLFSITALILSACTTKEGALLKISNPGKNAESVYLTRDHLDRPVIAWTENENGVIGFLYAVSEDGGKSFDNKVKIPVPPDIATHAEGMPKIAFKKNGTVVVVYETKAPTSENKYAGAIVHTQSTDDGKTWSSPAYIHSDTVSGRSRSFFDIERLSDGEIGAAWLDIKLDRNKSGRSVRFAKTHANRFGEEILIDSSACECCRIDIYADKGGRTNIAYRALRKGLMGQSVRDIMLARYDSENRIVFTPVSTDNWMIDGCPHTGPSITENENDLHVLWYTEGGSRGIFYSHAGIKPGEFDMRESISVNGRHPQISGSGKNILMVWEETVADENGVANRIKYQIRNESGIKMDYLTSSGMEANFPVIFPSQDSWSVAFLMKVNNVTSVYIARIQ
jgi:hypothetical protein